MTKALSKSLEAENARQQAIAELDGALKDVYEVIKTKITNVEENHITSAWEIGEQVAKVSDSAQSYGEGAVPLLAKALYGHAKGADNLYTWANFYREYPKKLLQQLLKDASKSSKSASPLTLSHLTLLSRVATKKKNAAPEEVRKLREKFETMVIEQKLSVADLALEAEKYLPGKKAGGAGGPGRPINAPKNVLVGLRQVKKFCGSLTSRSEVFSDYVVKPLLGGDLGDQSESDVFEAIQDADKEVSVLLEQLTTIHDGLTSALSELEKRQSEEPEELPIEDSAESEDSEEDSEEDDNEDDSEVDAVPEDEDADDEDEAEEEPVVKKSSKKKPAKAKGKNKKAKKNRVA